MKLRPVLLGCAFVFVLSGPAAAQTANVGANFATLNLSNSGFIPPDTMGAVGPSNFTQLINGAFRVYRKDGVAVTSATTDTAFFAAAGQTGGAGDNRVIFDPLTGRWFASSFTSGTPNSLIVSRSDTSNPAGTWKAVKISPGAGHFYDFPTLGLDRNGVYIGTNNFSGTNPQQGLFSFSKADLMLATPTAANATLFTNIDANTYTYIPQGVVNFNLGQSASAPGQVFGSDNESFNKVNLLTINNPGAAGATLGPVTDITVATFAVPPTIKQPNAGGTAQSTTTIENSDERFGSYVSRVGNLIYAVHATAVSGRSALRLTVINATSAAVVAESTIAESTYDLSYPSIAANDRGDFVIGYSKSGFVSSGSAANRYVGAYATAGNLTGSTVTYAPQMELRQGSALYTLSGSGRVRWGDYSATTLDPADPGIFWTNQEFAAAGNSWGTQASEIVPTVAGEVRWKAAAAGTYATSTSWFNDTAPTATDHVIFSRNGDGTTNYTVTMPAAATTVDRVSVRQGVVTLSLPAGSSLTATNTGTDTPSLAVAEYLGTTSLTVSGGGTLNTVTTTIGAGRNSDAATNGITNSANVSTGTLTIADVTWNNTGDVYVGGSATTVGGRGTLNIGSGGAKTIGGTLTVWNTASAVNVTAGAALTVGGLTNPIGTTPTVTLTGSTLTVNGNFDSTFRGTIAGTGAVQKAGSGNFTLTAANTYTGATTVSGGTLTLTGSASVAASPTLTVGTGATLSASGLTSGANFGDTTNRLALASGQTLRGTGTVDTGVIVQAGTGIRGDAGTGTGTLTVNGAVVLVGASGSGGATLTTFVSNNGTPAADSSKVAATDLNLVIDTTNKLNLVLALGTNTQFNQQQTYTATVATASGTIQLNGVPQAGGTVLDPSTYNLTSPGMLIDPGYQLALSASGQELVLTFTPVPEPGVVLAVAGLVLGAGRRLRRSRLV